MKMNAGQRTTGVIKSGLTAGGNIVPPSFLTLTSTSVNLKEVEDAFESAEKFVYKLGEKTTALLIKLENGFELLETSACVDAAKYNEEIGIEICSKKIKDKIWAALGFLLQEKLHCIKQTGSAATDPSKEESEESISAPESEAPSTEVVEDAKLQSVD